MTWLFFATEQQANDAIYTISLRLGYPSKTTTRWAEPRETLGGEWGFAKPDCDISDITGYSERPYNFIADYYDPEDV